eukprot:scaffold60854_cov59-Attheya_sp.AAC.1
MAMPRRRHHVEAIFYIYACLDKQHNLTIVFDLSSDIDMRDFKICDWKTFYGDIKEALPPNAPQVHGKKCTNCMSIKEAGNSEDFIFWR